MRAHGALKRKRAVNCRTRERCAPRRIGQNKIVHKPLRMESRSHLCPTCVDGAQALRKDTHQRQYYHTEYGNGNQYLDEGKAALAS